MEGDRNVSRQAVCHCPPNGMKAGVGKERIQVSRALRKTNSVEVKEKKKELIDEGARQIGEKGVRDQRGMHVSSAKAKGSW